MVYKSLKPEKQITFGVSEFKLQALFTTYVIIQIAKKIKKK